jgi:hypothetical protein
MSEKAKTEVWMRSCPKCRSTNLQTEPLYDWDDGLTDEIGLFCVTCGHYLGETLNHLQNRSQNLHSSMLSSFSQHHDQASLAEKEDALWGRNAASPDFD